MAWLISLKGVALTIVNSLGDFGDDDLEVYVLLVESLQFGVHVVDQGLLAVGHFGSVLPGDHLGGCHGVDLLETDA